MRRVAIGLVALTVVGACAPAAQPTAGVTSTVAFDPSIGLTEVSGTTRPVLPASSMDARAALSGLLVNDQPRTFSYRREEWPHWRDIDGDGCDARDQALKAASNPAAEVLGACEVRGGTWFSAYDGQTFTVPGELDVDHLVPLENAHESGGWQWETDRRARFANDQGSLWVVSASSNRSKGSKAPDEWRPPSQGVWCEYARRWVSTKLRWQLTVRTEERDSLGQMLDTCGP